MSNSFGTLVRTKHNIKSLLNENTMEIDYLFSNTENKLEKMTVIQAERQIALDNLRKLTQELKTKRLEYNTNPKFKYFS